MMEDESRSRKPSNRVSRTDREQCVSVVKDAWEFLGELPTKWAFIVPGRYHDPLTQSWQELNPRVKRATPLLWRVSGTRLWEHGLAGKSLRLKLKTYNEALDRFRDTTAEESFQPTSVKRMTRIEAALDLLEAFELLLDSLSAVVPALGAVKEMLNAVRLLLKEFSKKDSSPA
jgi:hypothetical protein